MSDKNNSGFTFAEVVITTIIFLLLIMALYVVFTTGKSSWQIGNVYIELQQELRKALDWTAEELRQSGSLVISNVPANGNWYNTISFRIPQGVTNGNLIWQVQQIQYLLGGLNGRQLLRQLGTEQKVLANNITSFQVRRQATARNIVEISLQAEKTSTSGHLVRANLSFQIKLRN